MIRRRTAVMTATGFSIVGLARAAQGPIGWISQESRETTEPFLKAFKAGLLDQFAGRGVPPSIEKYVTGGAASIEQAVRELEKAGVALIVAQGSATVPVVRASPSVPVVFGFSGDPIVAGIAKSLAQPGGTATGVSFMSVELMPKRINLLRMALPACRRIGLLSNALHAGEENEVLACQRAVEAQGIEMIVYRARGGDEIAPAVDRAMADRQAIVMLPSATMVQVASATARQCAAKKIPLVSGWAAIARAGAMMTYGPNLDAAYRRVAYYVLQVLNGTPPGNLPIEQPTLLELVLNGRTASEIGVPIPATLLAQADHRVARCHSRAFLFVQLRHKAGSAPKPQAGAVEHTRRFRLRRDECAIGQRLFISAESRHPPAMSMTFRAQAQRMRVEAEHSRRAAAQMSLLENRQRLLSRAEKLDQEATEWEQKADELFGR